MFELAISGDGGLDQTRWIASTVSIHTTLRDGDWRFDWRFDQCYDEELSGLYRSGLSILFLVQRVKRYMIASNDLEQDGGRWGSRAGWQFCRAAAEEEKEALLHVGAFSVSRYGRWWACHSWWWM